MTVDLHLVSWNRPKMTELVIKTIHRNTKRENFRLTVLDNGSDESTQEMLLIMGDNGLIDELITHNSNIGLEAAREQMRRSSTYGKYFIDIDNDCLPEPMQGDVDWVDRLIDLMERFEDYAAISCRTQVMIGSGNIFENESNAITDFPHPGGSLRIMNTDAAREVGGWEDNKPGRGTEERYICGKLRAAGYKTGFATHIYTLHLFGTRGGDQETDRWGYDKDFKPEETGHSDIWHPALANGDDPYDVEKFAGKELTKEYFQ